MVQRSHIRATKLAAMIAFLFGVFFLICLAISLLPPDIRQGLLKTWYTFPLFDQGNWSKNLVMGVGGLVVAIAAWTAVKFGRDDF